MHNRELLEQELERRIRDRNLRAVKSMYPLIPREKRGWFNNNGETFLHIALSVHDEKIFNWLYSQMENHDVVFSVDYQGQSLVFLAAKTGKTALAIRLLMQLIASDKFTTHRQRGEWFGPNRSRVSIVHLAAQKNTTEFMELLMPVLIQQRLWDGMLNEGDNHKKTPLHYAFDAKAFDNIVFLINCGADLFQLDNENRHFLTWFETSKNANDEEKIDLFRRIHPNKQLQMLNYFYTKKQEPEAAAWYEKLVAARAAQFSEEDIERKMYLFRKGLSQLFDEDRRVVDRIIKKADTLSSNLSSRPHPSNKLNFALSIIAGVLAVLFIVAAVIIPVVCIPTFLIQIIFFSAHISLGAWLGSTLGAFIGGVIMGIASGVACRIFSNRRPPPVLVSYDEVADLIHDLDNGIVKKCETSQETDRHARHSRPYLDSVREFRIFLNEFKEEKSVELWKVTNSVDALKDHLDTFRTGMFNSRVPFSIVPPPVQVDIVPDADVPADEPTPIPVPAENVDAALPRVTRHWATLHSLRADSDSDSLSQESDHEENEELSSSSESSASSASSSRASSPASSPPSTPRASY
jgi:hypothetical protein